MTEVSREGWRGSQQPAKPFAALAAAVEASILLHGLSIASTARAAGIARNTLARRLDKPGAFTIPELAALGLTLEDDMFAFFRISKAGR